MTRLDTTARSRSRAHRLRAPGLVLAGLAVATLAVQARDPHVAGSWGECPSVLLLGVWCPACGGLRAVHDLGHGDLLAAAGSNLLLVAVAPFVLALLAAWSYAAWSGRRLVVPPALSARLGPRSATVGVAAVVGLVLAFTVLRNLPAGAWLAP